jgi:hypothetical protein
LIDFILNDGMVNSDSILSPEMAEAMWMPADVRIASPMRYGLGFFIENYRETRRVGHGGNVEGYSALLETLPEYGLVVVVLANSGGFDASPIFDTVVDLLIDLPETSELTSLPPAFNPNDYAGTYELRDLNGQPTFTVIVTITDDGLQAQVTGQPPLNLRPTAPDVFDIYFGETSTGQKMTFVRDATGEIVYVHAGSRAAVRVID